MAHQCKSHAPWNITHCEHGASLRTERPRITRMNADKLDGTIQGVVQTGQWGAVQNVGVAPEHRGRGLGRALVLKSLSGFRTAGVPRVYLEVTARNTAAVQLYRSLGFRLARTTYKAVDRP